MDKKADTVGRRRVLQFAGAAAVGASAVVAATASPAAAAAGEVWLTTLTGSGDESSTIQAAINALGADGGVIRIPPGTYYIGSTLTLGSNVTLVGAGITSTELRDHANLGNDRLIEVIGSGGSRRKNVAIRDLSLRNGTATTGTPTVGREAIRVEYVDGFTLERVRVHEIQGWYGVSVVSSTNILVRQCYFYRCSHTMLAILIECDGVSVAGNVFDTVTTTNQADSYLVMTGAEALDTGTYFVRNLLIEDNMFLNNPRWEGIDCHGAENVVIRRNLVRNCKVGVALQKAHGYLAEPSAEVLINVLIADNVIEQGNGNSGQAGISVVGNNFRLAQNIRIIGNVVTGFTGQDLCPGSITLYCAQNVWIEDNELWTHGVYGVCFWTAVFDVTIRSNRFIGANSTAAQNTNCAAIGVTDAGAFGLILEDNTVDSPAKDRTVKYFVFSASKYESWQIRNNRVQNVTQSTPYNAASRLPVARSAVPTTDLVQQFGDLVYDTNGKPGWVVSSPSVGYGSLDTSTVVVKGTIASGTNVLTIVGGGAQDYRAIPPGMNIAIAGAGAAGAVLNARVLQWNIPGTVELDTNASTSVTAANVKYQGLTLAAV